jgi:hypothetical protein
MKKKNAKSTRAPKTGTGLGPPVESNVPVEPAPGQPATVRPALPPATSHLPGDPYRVDVVGKVPEDIHVDPDITQGHRGYEESGDSEIIPLERFARKDQSGNKASSG